MQRQSDARGAFRAARGNLTGCAVIAATVALAVLALVIGIVVANSH